MVIAAHDYLNHMDQDKQDQQPRANDAGLLLYLNSSALEFVVGHGRTRMYEHEP